MTMMIVTREWVFSLEPVTVRDLIQLKTIGENNDTLKGLELMAEIIARRAVPPATMDEVGALTTDQWGVVLQKFYASLHDVANGVGLIARHGLM